MSREGPSKSAYSGLVPQPMGGKVIDGNLMDGEGSLAHRASKLMQLQRLGVVDKVHNFPDLTRDPNAFKTVEHFALTAAREKATGKGFLLRHIKGSDPRLQEVWYEGDPSVCWKPYKAPGFIGKINKEVGVREETVKLREGQRIAILDENGNEVSGSGPSVRKDTNTTSSGTPEESKDQNTLRWGC